MARRRRRVPVPGTVVVVPAAPTGYAISMASSASAATTLPSQRKPAYAKSFQIQTSNDAATWTTIYSKTTGTGGTQYGYSLFEFQVGGDTGTGGGCGTTNAALNRPVSASSTENAGTPATAAMDGNAGTRWSGASIQSSVDNVFNQTQSNQFGSQR